MSYTTLFRIDKKQRIEPFKKFKNSHLSGPFVWDTLATSYLNMTPLHLAVHGTEADWSRLWALAKPDSPANRMERITLRTTFDYAICLHPNLKDVAFALRTFMEMHPGYSTLVEQADAIDELAKVPRTFGCCWQQTSITCMWQEAPEGKPNTLKWYPQAWPVIVT